MNGSPRKLNILLIAPHYDKNVPGESWSSYKWVQGLSSYCNVTVLTTHSKGWSCAGSPTGAKQVVDWTDAKLPNRFSRVNYEMNPGYLVFYCRVRNWIKQRLRDQWDFDLVHQLNPLALRYPCPAAGLGIPYILGPLAGSLTNPTGFADEGTDRQWYRKLRNLDRLRLRYDPLLRRTYAGAELIFGVAPYVRELLTPCGIKRFEILSETGVDTVLKVRKKAPVAGEPFRLLFVGRIIRTKGVIDAIRAVAIALKNLSLRYDIIGDGDHLQTCKEEVMRLGIQDHVHFHGWLPRADVENWYQNADVFLFPSFREPSGNVVFESMKHGLPVITSTLGGPGHVVDESCGIRVIASNPAEYAERLSHAITKLASDPECLKTMSNGAFDRLEKVALWESKIQTMLTAYNDICFSDLNPAEA